MAGTPVASPQIASTIGLKNVVIAPLTTDTEEGHSYGELQLLAGAIEASITPESRLIEDLKADSANVMVMIMDLEDKYGIMVEDDQIMKLKTVGDVVAYIEKHQ